jgi:predicted acetyltransferase
MLGEARRQGLAYVELTVDPENIVSQRVIAACEGVLVERFRKTAAYGFSETLRYRIQLEA